MFSRRHNFIFFVCLTFFELFITSISAEACKPEINRVIELRRTLFCAYDSSPVSKLHTNKNATEIFLRFEFKYFEFNHWDNTLSLSHWLIMKWKDDQLTWNPKLFDDIESIGVSVNDLWMPDLTIYNPSGMYDAEVMHTSVICEVKFDGQISCVVPNTYHSLCVSDHTNFPYDEHRCTLQFGSFLYTTNEVKLRIGKAQLVTHFSKNLEWEPTNATLKNVLVNSTRGTQQYVEYTIAFKRHSQIHEATLIVPMLVLILFTILAFFTSPNESERYYLIVFNILSHVTIFYWIPWKIPSAGPSPPIIVTFYRDSLLISGLVLIESAFVGWIERKSTNIPATLIPLFGIISKHKHLILLTVGEKQAQENQSTSITSNGVEESGMKTESLEEHSTVVANTESIDSKSWYILRLFIDRVSICVVTFLYIILFISHMPK